MSTLSEDLGSVLETQVPLLNLLKFPDGIAAIADFLGDQNY